MNISLFVQVDDANNKDCSRHCSFLYGSDCLLFNDTLEDSKLPAGYVWQDETAPTKERCYKCLLIG